jgi:hypothetical protein
MSHEHPPTEQSEYLWRDITEPRCAGKVAHRQPMDPGGANVALRVEQRGPCLRLISLRIQLQDRDLDYSI